MKTVKKTKNGTVFLVGAGPGDPELITKKAIRVLGSADCVIYDSLANSDLLDYAPEHAERIFVGKRGGMPSASQDAINKLCISKARTYNVVVRLKGGDPLVFGRGGEEMDACFAKHIPFELVPGISSAIAAPAYAGIPLTHRALSRSFAVCTGHLQAGESADKLVLPNADTVVILMGMENLPVIIDKLLAQGKYTKQTPAAIVQNGTCGNQKSIIGTLGTITALKKKKAIGAPAVFIVGEVISCARTMEWRNALPLVGKRVVVLRTVEQSYELCDRLYAAGAWVVRYPVIAIKPLVGGLKKISSTFLKQFSYIVFTSPNGVNTFFNALLAHGCDARTLSSVKICCIGSKTALECMRYGIVADIIPKQYIAEGLLASLPKDMTNQSVLIPRAQIARDVLEKGIAKRGGTVTVLPLYKTENAIADSSPVQDGDYVVFTSSSMVQNFFSVKSNRTKKIVPFALGKITAAEIKKHTRLPVHVSDNATLDDMMNSLVSIARME